MQSVREVEMSWDKIQRWRKQFFYVFEEENILK